MTTTGPLKPTDEQRAATEAFASGGHLILEAGAGSGKTTTLKMLAAATPKRRGIYLAFNKAVAVEAASSFPSNVSCSTAHSLAFKAIGYRYRRRINGPRIPGRETARLLGINDPYRASGDRMLAPPQLARVALETVQRFCYSASGHIDDQHVPNVVGIDTEAERDALAAVVVPLARRAWDDLTAFDGRLRFSHDIYLKLWQLSDPHLEADFVLLDEAQDSNPVVASIFRRQRHLQRVLVGDANQAIYGWRGATNAMRMFREDADNHLYLSQSFRFGPAVADEANKLLELLAADLRIVGSCHVDSRVGRLTEPAAVLCRTNATAVANLLSFHESAVPVALVGGGKDIRSLAEAAISLKNGRGTHHPELCAFQTWAQVQEYVDHDHAGADLKVFVRLIDEHGPDTVIHAIDRTVDEKRARVVVSTAHKAKGREWTSVRIADDFPKPKEEHGVPAPPPEAEQMLAYVAVTRARHVLDNSGLSWIDKLLADLAAQRKTPTIGFTGHEQQSA